MADPVARVGVESIHESLLVVVGVDCDDVLLGVLVIRVRVGVSTH